MQCPHCHHSFDDAVTELPAICPSCGAATNTAAVAVATAEPVEPEGALATPDDGKKPAKAAKAAGGGRNLLNDLLLSFLLVGAIGLAAWSTLVAMNAMEERDTAEQGLASSTAALDGMVSAAATSGRLKGTSAAEDRKAIFEPVIKYYMEVANANSQGEPAQRFKAAEAHFRAAGLQAKIGKPQCLSNLRGGCSILAELGREDHDPADYPSLNETALSLTTPFEWATMEGVSLQEHTPALIIGFQRAMSTFSTLASKYPQATSFREDQVGLQRIGGSLQALVPERRPFAIRAWNEARDLLESLVRDQPGNADYKAQLVEALVSSANLQKQTDETAGAIENLKRAVEVQQQLVDSNPDDKKLAENLEKYQKDLAKLEPDASASADASAAQ